MLNNLLRKSFTFGIVVLLFGICFTSFSLSSSISQSNISSNDSDILYYLTARLSWNDDNVDYEVSGDIDLGYSESWIGPFGLLTYGWGWEVNISLLLLDGIINVKPQNEPRLTLHPGDRISMIILFVFFFGDDYGHSLVIGRAFDVAIEKA